MPIRSILVAAVPGTDLEVILDAALGLARRMEGHLNVLLLQPDPTEFVLDYPELDAALVTRMSHENARRDAAMQQRFEVWREDKKLPASIVSSLLRTVYARWSASAGPPVAGFLRRARLADLIVTGIPTETAGLGAAIVNAALFDSGRPVLVIPGPCKRSLLDRVAVGWNSSLPSVRSLAAAMPFLHEAEQVDILAVAVPHEKNADPSFISAESVVEALSWQGVQARAVHPGIEDGETAGAALLREAASFEISLLALGAFSYGHATGASLGGVTATMLKNATVPLLMTA
jgi:nucleotide-binding universal stress UspA family protein